MDDLISRQAAMDALSHMMDTDGFRDGWAVSRANVDCMLRALPSAHPDNHEVACLLAELFGDTCACNFNDIDEWLPERCEFLDACPDPGGVTCWEQFLKHRAERKTDE